MEKLHPHEITRAVLLKCLAMCIGIALMIYAHQTEATYYINGSNSYDRCVSLFCVIWTGLVLIEYWQSLALRAVAGLAFLGCLNMVFDEFLFRPDIVGTNEIVSGAVIICVTGYNLINAIIHGQSEPDTP